jgi:NAD(P)H-hydrate repair Nnr-like enzyme with NAD(P)H-hydrate dehydratase domain
MADTYWFKQANDPLFAELEWNKPERRDQAGKLLIIGGDQHNLNAPAEAFTHARTAGIGAIQVALPDKTKRMVAKSLPEALFLPSTPSGEFSTDGEVELLDHAVWADTILMPGDSGRNSQTTILFEDLLRSYKDQITLTRDAVDILSNHPKALLERPYTTLIVSFAQLQKLLKNYSYPQAISFTIDLVKLVELLHELSQNSAAIIVTEHQNQLIVASAGKVSTTKLNTPAEEPPHWRIKTASLSACYQTWYPAQTFEALTHACFTVANQ